MKLKAMQIKLNTLNAAAEKGIVMEICNKKNRLSRIRFTFIMLLFAMCVTMNAFFCSNDNLYELLNKTTGYETWTISESIVDNNNGNNTARFKASFFIKNNSYDETIAKNICSAFMAAIPNGISLLLFLIIVFLLLFLTLFILLPDGWTLVNQKVRLNN